MTDMSDIHREDMASMRDQLLAEIHKVEQRLTAKIDGVSSRIDEHEVSRAVMEERVATLIKFVDRLATVVYTSAGGLFITIVGSAILTKGG